MKKNPGFTMIEVLIMTMVVAIFVSVAMSGNIISSFLKSRDAKRKTDTQKIQRIIEDYYNDKNSYPASVSGLMDNTPWGSGFSPYTTALPKDPGTVPYYYFTDNPLEYYVLFAKLENSSDPDIDSSGCTSGCGPASAYNFAVHSTNVRMVDGNPVH